MSQAQITLSAAQIEAFYHDEFVKDQVNDFSLLAGDKVGNGVVVDIGGGVGHFAHDLAVREGFSTRVIDMDPVSVERCMARGVQAMVGDALAPKFQGDENAACFNLILHHLVGINEAATRHLQHDALVAWRGTADYVFVNEYIYESYVGNLSGRLIFEITSSKILSAIGSMIAKVIPAFKANTFGIGVRFRAHQEWVELFGKAGYAVIGTKIGEDEPVSFPLRGLLIRSIRRDSFLLQELD